MTGITNSPETRQMAAAKTDRDESFIDFTMLFDPLREIVAPEAYVHVTPLGSGLDFDNIDEVPDLYGFLARPHFAPSAPELMDALEGLEGDPFPAGGHFRPRPTRTSSGEFAFSLVIAISAEDARKVLETRSPRKLHVLEKAFQRDVFPDKYLAIGYATLEGRFRRQIDAAREDCEEVTAEDEDPRRYDLYLKPDAFFLSAPFRGIGLGRLSGALLAQPIFLEILWLHHRSLCFEEETLVEVNTYFEIYSEGGEAAINFFHAELEVACDYVKDGTFGAGKGGLKITEIYKDGGW